MFCGFERTFPLVAMLAISPMVFAQSASELLEKGIYTEETAGDLDAAIGIYEQIVENHDANHTYIARAQYQLGICYAKKGLEEDAAIAFRKVVDRYPDQSTLVARARVRLSELGFGTNGETLAMSTRQVWAPALDNMGTPSPDGRYLTYVNWDNGNLAVHDIQTGENRDLTDEGTWETPDQFGDVSIWSPDSRQIAYCWFKGKDAELRIVGLDASKPRVLCEADQDGGHAPWPRAWSQDGKYILAISGKKDESQKLGHEDRIVLVSVADGSIRLLKSLGRRHTRNMSLSPDGRYVIYGLNTTDGSSKPDIYLLATDGSRDGALVKHPARDWAPFWAPDGKRIAFMSDRSGSKALWTLEVDEGRAKGTPTIVKEMPEKFYPTALTPDGSFYYNIGNPATNVYVATLNFQTGEVVAAPTKLPLPFEGSNYAPTWSPDGKYLAYASRRGARNDFVLVIRSVDTGEERNLSPESLEMLAAHSSGPLSWTRDGRSILVAGRANGAGGHHGLHLVDVQTGDFTTIVEHEMQAREMLSAPLWPVISNDGKRVYYIRGRSLIAHDLETQEMTELYGADVRITRVAHSPDGQRLAFVEVEPLESRPAVVKTISTSGGKPGNAYTLGDAWLRGLSWTPDGDLIVIERPGNDPENNNPEKMMIIPAGGGDAREMKLDFKVSKVSVHPDGQRITFIRPEPGGGMEFWALENFLPESTAGD